MKIKYLLCAGAIGISLSSCTIYEQHVVTSNPVGTKVGIAKGKKNFTYMQAAKNGQINKIATADMSVKMFLIFPMFKIKVTGE